MDLSELVYIDETGYHYVDYPTFLEWRQQQYRAIYGADTYLEADSEDGQLLAVQAKSDYDTAALGAAIYNSFSPVTAQGIGLSRNVKINGLNRLEPSYSTVTVTVVGQEDTPIVNGIAQDILGQKWNLPASVTIPNTGTIDVLATAQEIGFVSAEANTITTIFTPTLGWQTVNNVAAATPGAPVETDANLRVRQSVSTANPSLTVFDGTNGAVKNIPGVTKEKGYENDTDVTDANGIPEHSICCVVAGGDDTAIAQAIQVHKTPGTGTYGDTTVEVFDAHGMPLEISFQRAVTATIKVEITISVTDGWSNDYITLIQESVAAAINAGEIGDTILYTKLFAPAYLVGTPAGQTYDIATLEIGKNLDPVAAANIDLDFDENPVCDPTTDVTVNVT